jgi:hypothetical protein
MICGSLKISIQHGNAVELGEECVQQGKGQTGLDQHQVRVQRLYPKTVLKLVVRTMLVPVPRPRPSVAGY